MATWYVSSAKWALVTQWAATTAYNIGDLRRQLTTPTRGFERVFRCTTAGTSNSTEPNWSTVSIGRGATVNDNTVVWTEVTGNSTYNSAGAWNAPYAAADACVNLASANDDVYVDYQQNESVAGSYTLGTSVAGVRTMSVDPTNNRTRTGAAITTTGSNALSVGSTGYGYFYGFTFGNASGSVGSTTLGIAGGARFDSCTFNVLNTGGSGGIGFNSTNGHLDCINCSFSFGATVQRFFVGTGSIRIRGGGLTGSTIPTGLFSQTSNRVSVITFEDFDTSMVTGSGKQITSGSGAANTPIRIMFSNCKMGVGWTVDSTFNGPGCILDLVGCDTGGNQYNNSRYMYEGTMTTTSAIYASLGSTDAVTHWSHKVVTSANCNMGFPFSAYPNAKFNELTGSRTVSVEIAVPSASAVVADNDIWLDIDYYDTASSLHVAHATTNSTGSFTVSSGVNLTSSATAWTGLGSYTAFTLTSPSITIGQRGFVKATVRCGKASTTFYVDGKVTIT